MAHVRVEYSANLVGNFDLPEFLALIARHMGEQANDVFPVGGIRVRAVRFDDYVIADGKGEQDAFLNIDVKIGAGRSEQFRKDYFDALFSCVEAWLASVFAARPFALSLYVEEAEGWKANTIPHRLKKAD